MRLRVGMTFATFTVLALLLALPWALYTIHVVGPDFRTVGPDGATADDPVRQLNGRWTLLSFEHRNVSWQTTNGGGPLESSPLSGGGDGGEPNANALQVFRNYLVAVVAAFGALALGAVGTYNVARHDRYRMFTAASFVLAAVLLLGGCVYLSNELPGAMWADANGSGEGAFGAIFAPYIDPEGGEPGYYFEFDGGYPSTDPALREQLQYGPGRGWWLAGAAGVLALVTAGLMVNAPSWEALGRQEHEGTVEVVRYVPVPTTTTAPRQRRRYPKRMPAVSRNSPTYRRRR